MARLNDIIQGLREADETLAELGGGASGERDAGIVAVNADAIAKRRHDLEHRLLAYLRGHQLDLIQYQMASTIGAPTPAAAAARAILRFQEIVTTILDAVRVGPKDTYAPDPESVAMAGMILVSADAERISLSVANDQLLAMPSDLDIALDLTFGAFGLRSAADLADFASRVGVAPVVHLYDWARNNADNALDTLITLLPGHGPRRSLAVTRDDSICLADVIGVAHADRTEVVGCECELISIDDVADTFRLRSTAGEEYSGFLTDDFLRGESWLSRAPYHASLRRRVRISYATGEASVRWMLRELTPLG